MCCVFLWGHTKFCWLCLFWCAYINVLLAPEDVLGSILIIDLSTSWSKAFMSKNFNLIFNYWVYSVKHARHFSVLFLEYFERIYKKNTERWYIVSTFFSFIQNMRTQPNIFASIHYLNCIWRTSIYHEFIFNHCRPGHAWSICHWTQSNQQSIIMRKLIHFVQFWCAFVHMEYFDL